MSDPIALQKTVSSQALTQKEELIRFLLAEQGLEKMRNTELMRLAGYPIDIAYRTVTLATCDALKEALGGLPQGALLLMAKKDSLEAVVTLLRVQDSDRTPLYLDQQKTIFNLQKTGEFPDVWTSAEITWTGLSCQVLGSLYPDPRGDDNLIFSGDAPGFLSPARYVAYMPDDRMLETVIGSAAVAGGDSFVLGHYRATEYSGSASNSKVRVSVPIRDLIGQRTGIFGKTRVGKSNVMKVIAAAIIDWNREHGNEVGQLVVDPQGEYAHSPSSTGGISLHKLYPSECTVFAVAEKAGLVTSRQMMLDFYLSPAAGMNVLRMGLESDGRRSDYRASFLAVSIPEPSDIMAMPPGGERVRAIRKLQFWWAVLADAGFAADDTKLKGLVMGPKGNPFDPGFTQDVRKAIHGSLPPVPALLGGLLTEMKALSRFAQSSGAQERLKSTSGSPLLDADDMAMLKFLCPPSGSGPAALRPYRRYHSPGAGDFITEILGLLGDGGTVILDTSACDETVGKYFTETVLSAVYRSQTLKNLRNELGERYIQVYLEEAHKVLPADESGLNSIYGNLYKTAGKLHIGITYATQSPSTIYGELLAETENILVGHLSAFDEAKRISKVQIQYSGMEESICYTSSPGYIRMLMKSSRIVVPVQVKQFGKEEV